MTTAIKQSKSLLSKLLASENIHVIHDAEAKTASFDISNRVLRLPIFKDMSDELYDMFVGHEVSHALYTPFTDDDAKTIKEHGCLHGAFVIAEGNLNHIHIAHQYLNVVEDARIERLIKSKFNGLRRDFYIGYRELHDKDFFQIQGENIEEVSFIDRINLFFKIGSILEIPFTDEEMIFVEMIENTQSFDDVIEVTKKIWEYAKEHDNNQSSSYADFTVTKEGDGNEKGGIVVNVTSDGDPSGGNDANSAPASAKTQKNFDDNVKKNFVDEETPSWNEPEYYAFPDPILENIIVDYKIVLDEFHQTSVYSPIAYANGAKEAIDFVKESKRVVNILAQEFMTKKAAKDHQRSSINRTGAIDTVQMMNYKFTDDIFKRVKIVKKGKSHGLVFFLDMSGSMSGVYEDTVKQLIQLVLFCERVNIPFEVYGFTTRLDNTGREAYIGDRENMDSYWKVPNLPPMYNTNTMQEFNLVNIFSSRMKKKELLTMIGNMFTVCSYYRHSRVYVTLPSRMFLSSTPLCEAINAGIDVVRNFKAKYNLDIVNSIFLTDGEPTGYSMGRGTNTYFHKRGYTMKYDTRYTLESNMIKMFKVMTGMKAISFFVNESKTSLSEWVCDAGRGENHGKRVDFTILTAMEKSYVKEGWTTSFKDGTMYDQKFILRGNRSVEYVDIDEAISRKKSNSAICNNFIKAMNKNTVSRVMLNRFVELIAKD